MRYQANWVNTGYWHLELRAEDRLLATDTGYRLLFVPTATLADEADIRSYLSQ